MEKSKTSTADAASHSGKAAKRRPGRAVIEARRTEEAIGVRLTASDIAAIQAQAAAMGLSRSAWVRALVRRRTQGMPTFSSTDEQSLIAILVELRRIGVDIRQTLRLMDAAIQGGEGLNQELAYLTGLRAEIRAQMLALHKAFEGNMAFWDVPA